MMEMNRRILVVAALAALAACATTKNVRTDAPVTVLEVDNQAVLDMNIYVMRSSQRIRLGTATGLHTSQFKIPNDLIFGATPLRFLADPIGANRLPVSDEISVAPGDTVHMTIPNQ
jgi:hypothetical protein